MNALESIRVAEHAARLQAVANYESLAVSLAKGEAAPPDVLAILTSAGKTTADLEAAVNLAAERLNLQPLADALPSILSDRATAEAELRAADEKAAGELEAFHKKLAAHLDPLRKRVADLQEAERQSRAAKSRLQNLAAKPNDARRFTTTVEVE